METTVQKEIEAHAPHAVRQLRRKHAGVFGEETPPDLIEALRVTGNAGVPGTDRPLMEAASLNGVDAGDGGNHSDRPRVTNRR